MKRNYDLRVLLRPYAEGDIIYLLDRASVKGKSRKLSAPRKGPALIVKKLSAYLYRVKLRNAVSLYLACKDKNAFFTSEQPKRYKGSLTVWALYAYFSDSQNAAFEPLVWCM